MQSVISFVEQHNLLIVALNAFLSQVGLPLPLIPTLMTAAVLDVHNPYHIPELLVAGTGGALLGDLVLYWCGRRYGRRGLGLLCKVSFSPDFCVRQTETVFAKVGSWSLLFGKFLPGLSSIVVAMAGITRMAMPTFLVLDGIGKLVFVAVAVALGWLFQNAIASVIATLGELGKFGVLVIAAAIALYLLAKWLRRRLFIRQLRMDRITVAELRKLIDDGEKLAILDVRPQEVRVLDGMIPGAVGAHPEDPEPVVDSYPRDLEIIVYCDCPNEASAATAAKHLKQAGFKKIRPLLGGIDAWVESGQSVESPLLSDLVPEEPIGAGAETV